MVQEFKALLPQRFRYLSAVDPHWQSLLSKADTRVPALWRDWLTDAGSLTSRLLVASQGDLCVRVLRQKLEVPKFSERQQLAIPDRQRALVREVLLYGVGQPWIYARSIMPLKTLTGRLKKLGQLSNQPLGELLFKDPTMRREPVEFAHFEPISSSETSVWGRRSVFRLDNKPLLVAEVFLPDFSP